MSGKADANIRVCHVKVMSSMQGIDANIKVCKIYTGQYQRIPGKDANIIVFQVKTISEYTKQR